MFSNRNYLYWVPNCARYYVIIITILFYPLSNDDLDAVNTVSLQVGKINVREVEH